MHTHDGKARCPIHWCVSFSLQMTSWECLPCEYSLILITCPSHINIGQCQGKAVRLLSTLHPRTLQTSQPLNFFRNTTSNFRTKVTTVGVLLLGFIVTRRVWTPDILLNTLTSFVTEIKCTAWEYKVLQLVPTPTEAWRVLSGPGTNYRYLGNVKKLHKQFPTTQPTRTY